MPLPRTHRPPRQRTLLLWLIACVLFVHGLAPQLATRMAAVRDGAAWAEVCSASGSRWVAAGEQPDSDPARQGHSSCWACLLGSQNGAPPPAALAAVAPAALTQAQPARRNDSAPARPVQGLAAARAPPRLS